MATNISINMNQFIKQQQELGREDLLREFGHDETLRLWVEHRITQTITNTGAELMRLAEGEIKMAEEHPMRYMSQELADEYNKGYSRGIDTIKQHITKLTGVEK